MSGIRHNYYLLHLLRNQLTELTSTRPCIKSRTIWKKKYIFYPDIPFILSSHQY